MKTHQFKPGDKFLAEIEVEKVKRNGDLAIKSDSVCIDGFDTHCDCHLIVSKWDTDNLHPAPREGEYRLTVDEIGEMLAYIDDYIAEHGVIDYNRCPKAIAKQWLIKHGKEDA